MKEVKEKKILEYFILFLPEKNLVQQTVYQTRKFLRLSIILQGKSLCTSCVPDCTRHDPEQRQILIIIAFIWNLVWIILMYQTVPDNVPDGIENIFFNIY